MLRLSDPATRRYKVRLAASIALVGVAVIACQSFFQKDKFEVSDLIVEVLVMAGAFAYTTRRQFWYIADNVSHDAQLLVAQRGNKSVSIPFSELDNIYAVNTLSGEGIEISLKNPVRPFGKTIVFMPPNWRNLKGEDMDDLAVRIKAQLIKQQA